jgi:hypothetical protein
MRARAILKSMAVPVFCGLCGFSGAIGVACSQSGSSSDGERASGALNAAASGSVKTVFIVLLENHNWSSIKGSSSAPYLNGTLLTQGSHAENYVNLPGLHPSEPNYIWLEAGNNFGITDDGLPSANHQSTTAHLVTQLEQAGISWKAYAEGSSATACPVTNSGKYAPKHVPFVFFDDIRTNSTRCVQHVRPYSELATDLANGAAPRYAFIVPDLCDDMHDTLGCATLDSAKNGDTWLSKEVPKILASKAYQDNGALFITWDESEGSDVPIGMIVLSPLAKGNGYSNTIKYTHSSTLRTVQEIFGVGPLLGGAATATDLSDLFVAGAIGGGSVDAGVDASDAAKDVATDAPIDTGVDASDAAVDSGTSSCAHPICASGGKLSSTCDPCATKVCASDSYCCATAWDNQCVGEVASICGQSCSAPTDGGTDTCAHPVCASGAKLGKTCSPCAGMICASDPYCCSTKWDSQCTGEVASICGQSCP